MLHYWGEKAPSVFCPRLLIRENRTNDQQSQREKAILIREMTLPQSQCFALRYTSFSLQETIRNPPPLLLKEPFPFHPPAFPGLVLANFEEDPEFEERDGDVGRPAVLLSSIT